MEGADRVAGQLCGDKECPFSGVTKSGRVWRKVPESGARSVIYIMTCMKSHEHFCWNGYYRITVFICVQCSPIKKEEVLVHYLQLFCLPFLGGQGGLFYFVLFLIPKPE